MGCNGNRSFGFGGSGRGFRSYLPWMLFWVGFMLVISFLGLPLAFVMLLALFFYPTIIKRSQHFFRKTTRRNSRNEPNITKFDVLDLSDENEKNYL